jgi:hypothetical protein
VVERDQVQRGLLITKIRIDGECGVCTNGVSSHIREWCACITTLGRGEGEGGRGGRGERGGGGARGAGRGGRGARACVLRARAV